MVAEINNSTWQWLEKQQFSSSIKRNAWLCLQRSQYRDHCLLTCESAKA
jgi:hypothetical protein